MGLQEVENAALFYTTIGDGLVLTPNEEWRTMESTVFGHPGEPKLLDVAAAPLFLFTHCRFGTTFELDGLRSRLELERDTK